MYQQLKAFKVRTKFSLRTMLVLMTVCCLAMGWYIIRAQNQQTAVKSITKNGGQIVYNSSYKNGNASGRPLGPAWLHNLIGLDYFDQVYGVDLSMTDVSDTLFLNNIPTLRRVWLRKTNINDLEFVPSLPRIEHLWIEDTLVDDLAPLSNCRRLSLLGIEGTKVTDLSPLYGLSELRTLNIARTNISPEEIQRFRAENPGCNVFGADD